MLTRSRESVNEIFDPDRVDEIYALEDTERSKAIADNRPTNYSVVRPELLDRLYEDMYHQRLRDSDKEKWRCQIQGSRELCDATETEDGKITLRFIAPKSNSSEFVESGFDFVLVGTGYTRDVHAKILNPIRHLFEDSFNSVERDYRLKLKVGAVQPDCGIWLQGCCEASHGVSCCSPAIPSEKMLTQIFLLQLSDTLLSILAVRGGELVDSMFGNSAQSMSAAPKTNGYTKGYH